MRFVLVISAVVMIAVAWAMPGQSESRTQPQPDAASPSPKPYGLGQAPFAQISSASCAAAACHGGGQLGAKGSEHSTWAATVFPEGPADSHARAYRILFNAESVRMGKLLGIAAPHKEALCLNCHSVAGVEPTAAATEGTGCGACHGPAEKWNAAHVQPGWHALTNRDKWERYGFVPTKNLTARVLSCAGCHVGDASREVNHDLIAAGHPRLAFEYTRSHFSPEYRHHWKEQTPQPDFEVRAWAVGQAATLRAATELLRVRAERAIPTQSDQPWPEFAGLSCFACHQRIGNDELNRGNATTPRPPGIAGWEVWSNAAVGVAANLCSEAFPSVSTPNLADVARLRELMNKRNPDPKAVAELASRAVAELDTWLADLQVAEDRGLNTRIPNDLTRKLAHALAANSLNPDRAKLADHDWDALATNYLGLGAMYHAAGGTRAVPGWTEPIRELSRELKFPTGQKGERFHSPAGFGKIERDRVRDRFRELFDATVDHRGKP